MAEAQGCCACVKYFLFLFNLLFFLIGLGSIGLGTYSLVHNKGDLAIVIDNTEGTFGGLLIAVGVIVCILAAAGCCGAMKEHRASLLFYVLTLTFVLVLELAAGGVGYHYRSQLRSVIDKGMKKTLTSYDPNDPSGHVERSWDGVQKAFGCCGVDAPDDWRATGTKWEDSTRLGFPLSCCSKYDKDHDITKDVCLNTEALGFRSDGCLTHVETNLKSRWGILAGAAIAIPVIQLLGIIFACGLRHHLGRHQDYYSV